MNIQKYKKNINNSSILKILLFPIIALNHVYCKIKILHQKEAFNKLSKILKNDVLIRVDEFDASFYINTKSDVFSRIVLFNSYEPNTISIFNKYIDPNKDVIDVGANIGLHTVFFSKKLISGKVFSIEPTYNALLKLKMNIEVNHVKDKVSIFEGVISDRAEMVNIKTISGKEEYSTLGSFSHPAITDLPYEQYSVNSITLDSLVRNFKVNPGFIKIDTEGTEHLVLKSAIETIQKFQPVILSEVSPYLLKKNNYSLEQLLKFMSDLNYTYYDINNPGKEIGNKKFYEILFLPS